MQRNKERALASLSSATALSYIPYAYQHNYSLLFYQSCPAVFVFFFTPLDACQIIIQFLSQFTNLEVINCDFFSFVNQCAYRGDNCCCTGSVYFFQSSVSSGLHKIIYRQMRFIYFVSPVFQNMNDGISGYTWKYCSFDRSCVDFAVDLEHNIFFHGHPATVPESNHIFQLLPDR